jgi:hypothetical protein
VLLGLIFMGPVALRWAFTQPLRALALVAGVACLSALASLFGRCARSAPVPVAVPVRIVCGLQRRGQRALGRYVCAGALALAGGYLFNARALQS